MKKIVFCNIAYMKYYCGSTEEDTPMNGGKYIGENKDGGEAYNFLDYNGKCYGYFMSYGDQMHIERLSGNHDDILDGVTVIWVAKKGDGENVIVGWYENASLYRYVQTDYTYGLYPESNRDLYYNIVADARNCFLLPVEERNFKVPRASKAGSGKGMGQSAVWYADSEYAKTVFVPEVLKYIESYRNKERLNFVYTPEFLDEAYPNGDKSAEELENLVNDTDNVPAEDALWYLNALLKEKTTPERLYLKADSLRCLYRFDESVPLYEEVLNQNGKEDAVVQLFILYLIKKQYQKAVSYGKILEKSQIFRTWDIQDKFCFFMNFAWALIDDGKNAQAEDYLKKLKALQIKEAENELKELEKVIYQDK